jgi:hypothetical protein
MRRSYSGMKFAFSGTVGVVSEKIKKTLNANIPLVP